ncbi:family 20 glycosylhydrolase [Elizabethkingia sp. JS20170427COW]|uniref:glycoside hydrolase family 20 protein n=1 Tax=Elizabethkingia sp. JS20170427COW TaxID=2583851 RepID=UPI001110DE58|nr:family 20 glycosylhydrolase [Elizabethkingia sp. JS20170427COW]QCX54213.1 beta-N-acetylhexosaminidase [Elizabethkingia sp. JS20170427COW]
MKLRTLLTASSLCCIPFFISAQNNFDLVPKPVEMHLNQGFYKIPETVNLYIDKDFKDSSFLLKEYPSIKTIHETSKKKASVRILKKALDSSKEGAYELKISSNGIEIAAQDKAGILNGIFTFIQLGYLQKDSSQLLYSEIKDAPRFGYRGLHLDTSRHYFPLNFLKKYIDLMAIYKLNNFHWHFTDGAGWRLEIKKYPELTQKAAWRTHALWKDWWNNGRQYVEQGTPNASGGFYTQDEAKELVKYAAERGINIIPEIEMPAHSEEVIAVYPELSCSGIPYSQSEFCIGNPKTFEFLKNVLDEVLEIFPSQYIHIGGDEADKSHWKTCPKDQALMKKEGLKSVDELQSYAILQMDKYLQSKGRKLVGWDEILDGGLTPGATVMSWRGEQGGITAANSGHDVIMTPGEFLYLDGYQTDPRTQPESIGGYLPIEKVYSYDPVSKDLKDDKKKHILGAQANLWTEYVPTTEHVEYMAYPRVLALAEVDWTEPEHKNYQDFHKRLQSQYALLQKLNVNYYRPSYNVAAKVDFNPTAKTDTVELTTEQNNKQGIHYTLDGSEPTAKSPVYTQPIQFTQSGTLKAAYFLDQFKVGPTLEQRIDIHKAIGKKVIYNQKWIGYEAQKELTLTNGIFGGVSYHDKQWQGFTRPMDVVVDFERPETISTVAMNFMQITGPGVYMPGEMRVFVSDDNKNFREVGVVKNDVSPSVSQLTFKRFELNLPQPVKARYLKVTTTNPGRGYLFTDEIIVY